MATTNAADAQRPRAFEIDGVAQGRSPTWYRGENCNYNPRAENLTGSDAVRRHVIAGWEPDAPFIGPQTRTVAFGSCFAANITKWLEKRDFNVISSKSSSHGKSYVARFGEGIVNTFVIRQQFEWALQGKQFEENLWHGYDATEYGYDEDIRNDTKAMFQEADVFIITLGLSEIWYDEVTGGVFWRAIPKDKYDPSRHKFRVSTVEENRENIKAIVDIISTHRPEARIIFTLSPIPLVATFRPVSCITANSVSKSVLRAALDEALRDLDQPDRVYYWPSFEIVKDIFSNPMKKDRRHLKKRIMAFIMTQFEAVWCHGSIPRSTLDAAWMDAHFANGTYPGKVQNIVKNDNVKALKRLMRRVDATDRTALLPWIAGAAAQGSSVANWAAAEMTEQEAKD